MKNTEKVGVASFSVCGLGNLYRQAITFGVKQLQVDLTVEDDYSGHGQPCTQCLSLAVPTFHLYS